MRGLNRIVSAIAREQHGVIARWQLLAAGISSRWIEEQLDKGTLIRVYRGVYRVGHIARSREADYMGAVLACGDDSVLSGAAAAALLGLIRRVPHPRPVVTTAKDRRIHGIATHRERGGIDDAMTWQGIPVTTPARTLVDLAAVVSAGELARAVHEAAIKHGTTPEDVDRVLARRPKSKGARTLREILHGDQGKTLS